MAALRAKSPTEREELAERLAGRLDGPITAAGIVLVLVVVADNMTPPGSTLKTAWSFLTWALWALFAIEFALRLVIAPSALAFLRRNWWQLVFLALPFLRFLRAFSRTARLARVASTSVRTTRTAGRTLAGRIGWLVGLAVSTILGSSQILYEYGPGMSYPRALHDATLGAIGGEPIDAPGALADAVEIVLAIHAAVVFAALAGSLGAYFLERRPPGGPGADGRGTPSGNPADSPVGEM